MAATATSQPQTSFTIMRLRFRFRPGCTRPAATATGAKPGATAAGGSVPSEGFRPQDPHTRSCHSPAGDWNSDPQRPQWNHERDGALTVQDSG